MRIHGTIAIAITVALGAAVSPAIADDGCEVTFVHAPDDLRLVIERWVRGEPRCAGRIELRAVPTEEGIYLLAQRPDGRIHERLVPDAESAGVLVASWVADDWVAGRPAPAPPALAPPAMTPSVPVRVDAPAVVATATPAPRSRRWLGLGGLVQTTQGGGGGARLELDVLAAGNWTVGVAGSATASDLTFANDAGYLHTQDLKLAGYLAWSVVFDRWQLRPAIGVGVVHTSAEAVMLEAEGWWNLQTPSGTFLTAETSLLLARELGRSWAIAAGPVVTFHAQRFGADGDEIARNGLDLMVLGGLRRRM